jgi:phosphohistidine phosphatase
MAQSMPSSASEFVPSAGDRGRPPRASKVPIRGRPTSLSSQRIYFLRHGLAGQRSKWHGTDADRPLSERGRAQVRRVSRALRQAGVQPDRIVTSPFARAFETAEIASDVFGLPQSPTIEALLKPGTKPKRLNAALSPHIEFGSVLLVGHEPSLSCLISSQCGRLQPPLTKAGFAEISIDQKDPRRWRLMWSVEPGDVVEWAHGQLLRRQR